MKQIRRSTFETNSSSTHSIAMMSEDDYNKWREGIARYNEWNGRVVMSADTPAANELEELAEDFYNDQKSKYWKDWKDVSEEDRKSFYQMARERLTGCDKDGVTYEDFTYGMDVATCKYTTSKNETVVAVSIQGYC